MLEGGAAAARQGTAGGDDQGDASLEKRIRRLEAIVAALDSDSLELEQALALFEEGVGHVRKAQEILAEAELKVEELIGRDGDEVRPMDAAGTDDD